MGRPRGGGVPRGLGEETVKKVYVNGFAPMISV
jgi:hypothetical protein